MEEYRINDYITLKLENNKTVIYLKKQKFDQCKIILLNIPTNEMDSLSETKSIDELIDIMGKDLKENHKKRLTITSYEEFWAHCSNLHAWALNNYDTTLLHKSLAFPLLKKITDLGDQNAKHVLKEEIAFRVLSGDIKILIYFIEENYFNYLNEEELKSLFYICNEKLRNNINDASYENNGPYKSALTALKLLTELGDNAAKEKLNEEYQKKLERENTNEYDLLVKKQYYKYLDSSTLFYTLLEENDAQVIMELEDTISEECQKILLKREISISMIREHCKIKPSYIIDTYNKEREPYSILIKNRRVCDLELSSTGQIKLSKFPKEIIRLTELERLNLAYNRIMEIPDSIEDLRKLVILDLNSNRYIKILPGTIKNLYYLRELYLNSNNLDELPKSMGDLKSLKTLNIANNKLKLLPYNIGHLNSLETLILYGNNLKSLPESFSNLTLLKHLNIAQNKFTTLPKILLDLRSLRFINIDQKHANSEVIHILKKKGVKINFN